MYRGQVLSGDVNVSAVSPDGKAGTRQPASEILEDLLHVEDFWDRLFSGRCTLGRRDNNNHGTPVSELGGSFSWF